MIRIPAYRIYALFTVILFIAISTFSIPTTQAQIAGVGQPSGKTARVSILPGHGNADSRSNPTVRPHAKRHGVPNGEQGDPLFLPAVTYESGGSANSMAVADVNRDGKLDVLVANGNANTVGVLLGNGDGTFQPAYTYDSGSNVPTAIAVADVNLDGIPDLVVTNDTSDYHLDGVIGVLLGNGDGTFRPVVTYSSGDRGAMGITIADVNNDHKPDLLVANDFNVAVLLGNGDGTFGAPQFYDTGGQFNVSIAVGDFNGDGRLDMAVAADVAGYNSVGILLGNGDGTFQPAVSYGSGGTNPNFVAVADLNGDHRLDLVVANTDSNAVGVLLGNGDGTFQPAVSYGSGGTNAAKVAVADVSGDGKPDLLVINNCPAGQGCLGQEGVLGVLLGNGDGTFQPAVTYDPGGPGADSVVAVDVNGDGKPDVLVGEGSVGVLLNSYGPHSPTVTTVASSLDPSIFGQTITFTSTVSSSSGVPTGTVEFFDGTTEFGSAELAGGSTAFSTSTLPAGTHPINAVYEGSHEFDRSGSSRVNEIVNVALTTLSLASSRNPAEVNQLITYTATVTGQYGGAVSGRVTFQDNGRRTTTVDLVNNLATFSRTYKSNGVHKITATYPGDANNAGSAAGLTEYIQTQPVASKTVVTTSGSPSIEGQPVTFTAAVTSKYGTIPDGELVTFYDGAETLGSSTLASGVASYTTSSLSAGSHYIKATYAGDPAFKTSSGHLRQVVKKK